MEILKLKIQYVSDKKFTYAVKNYPCPKRGLDFTLSSGEQSQPSECPA